jgi:hypothetical protein
VAKLLDAFGNSEEPAKASEPEPDRADVERLLEAFSGPAEEALRSSNSGPVSPLAPPVRQRPETATKPAARRPETATKPAARRPETAPPPAPSARRPEPSPDPGVAPHTDPAILLVPLPVVERERLGLDPDWDSLLHAEGRGAPTADDLDIVDLPELGSLLHPEPEAVDPPAWPNDHDVQRRPEAAPALPSRPMPANSLVRRGSAIADSPDSAVDALFGPGDEANLSAEAEPPHEIDIVVDTLRLRQTSSMMTSIRP